METDIKLPSYKNQNLPKVATSGIKCLHLSHSLYLGDAFQNCSDAVYCNWRYNMKYATCSQLLWFSMQYCAVVGLSIYFLLSMIYVATSYRRMCLTSANSTTCTLTCYAGTYLACNLVLPCKMRSIFSCVMLRVDMT